MLKFFEITTGIVEEKEVKDSFLCSPKEYHIG